MSKDLFSSQAAIYSRYRPSYPAALIEYILQFVPARQAVWDCATGNGQAALLLADVFEKVYATDLSEKQLQQAATRPNISYSVAKETATGFADNSFDAITVAQAYHWFDFGAFHAEAARVGRPGCVVAVWGYNMPGCQYAAINERIQFFYKEIAGPYWDAERRLVEEEYRTVPFAFDELPSRHFATGKQWTINDVAGYFNTWSSVQHFIKAKQYNPVDSFMPELEAVWPDKGMGVVEFMFPVFMRIGRVS